VVFRTTLTRFAILITSCLRCPFCSDDSRLALSCEGVKGHSRATSETSLRAGKVLTLAQPCEIVTREVPVKTPHAC
jgi:hypothetical protein